MAQRVYNDVVDNGRTGSRLLRVFRGLAARLLEIFQVLVVMGLAAVVVAAGGARGTGPGFDLTPGFINQGLVTIDSPFGALMIELLYKHSRSPLGEAVTVWKYRKSSASTSPCPEELWQFGHC